MATATSEKRWSAREIIEAIEQLDPDEAEKVSRRLLEMKARRKAPNMPALEEELLRQVLLEKPAGFQDRFDQLQAKRRTFTLTREEHEEMLRLVAESEAFAVRRLKALSELAQLRRTSVPALMKGLGLKAPPVG